MSTDPGYRVRLKARIGKGLSTVDSTRTANFHGRPLTVRAAGDDRTTSHLSPAGEDWMRSLGLLLSEHRTASDVHGLSVLPDDDNLRVFSSTADGRVTHDAAEFIRSLEEAAEGTESRETARALHALNLAQINHEPLAQVVLAVSSIEAMAADSEGWTDAQLGMIEWSAARVRGEFGAAANLSWTPSGRCTTAAFASRRGGYWSAMASSTTGPRHTAINLLI